MGFPTTAFVSDSKSTHTNWLGWTGDREGKEAEMKTEVEKRVDKDRERGKGGVQKR